MSHGESASERFRAMLEEAKPPTGGVAFDDIAVEVAPLFPLLSELPAEQRAGGNYESFEFRECFTVLTLLGRRLALLDLTPSAAVQIVRLALRSVEELNESSAEGLSQPAIAAAVEGFVLGREERVARTSETRAAKPLKPLRIDDGIFALIVSGAHEPSALSECVDALGRAMLNADVTTAIVDLTQLGEPNGERAAAVFAADEITRMLGGVCFFTGIDARWEAAAADARIPLEAMHTAPNLAEALAAAKQTTEGATQSRSPKWRALLDRFRR